MLMALATLVHQGSSQLFLHSQSVSLLQCLVNTTSGIVMILLQRKEVPCCEFFFFIPGLSTYQKALNEIYRATIQATAKQSQLCHFALSTFLKATGDKLQCGF